MKYISYIFKESKRCFSSYYTLIVLFTLWLYRIDFIPADDGGLAKGLQVFTLLGMLLFLYKKKNNIYSYSIKISNTPIKSLTFLYFYGMISTLWALIPTFSFFLAFQNLVMIFLFIYIFDINKSFKEKEKLFVIGTVLLMLFEVIIERIVNSPQIFIHFLSGGSTAALLFSYCIAELLNMRIKDKERRMYLKGSVIVSLIVLITSTSSGANASAVFGLIVALFFSRHNIYAILISLLSIFLYLNQGLIEDILLFIMPGKTMETIESGTGRESIWNEIYVLAAQKPWFGWGFACIERAVSNFGQIVSDAHNNFIGFYGSLGIVGLSIYVFHCINTFIFIFKRKHIIGFSGLFAAFCCVTLNGYSYGYLSGKTCSITIVYIATIVLAYSYSKCKIYSK